MTEISLHTPNKPNLLIFLEVSQAGYKPLKNSILKHPSVLTAYPRPQSELLPNANGGFWRTLRNGLVGPPRYEPRSVTLELIYGGAGITIVEFGFYAYAHNELLLSQAFQDISANDERIAVIIAAPNTPRPVTWLENLPGRQFELDIRVIPDRDGMKNPEWEALVGTCANQVIERILAFADKESLASNICSY